MSRRVAVKLPNRLLPLGGAGGRSIRSPSPAMLRSPSPALGRPTPVQKGPPKCQNCGQSEFAEHEGRTICVSCGVIMADDGNFANDVTFQENDNGRILQSGTRVGANQTHQFNYNPGARVFGGAGHESMPTGTKAQGEAQVIFTRYAVLLDIRDKEKNAAAAIFQMAYANGFVRGRTIESVAVVCIYLATRRAKDKSPPYSLMLIDFAEPANINVFDLGKMMQDMVRRLYISDGKMKESESILLRAPGAEVLIDKFVRYLDFGADENKIKKDAAKILQRMKKDWLHDGRRPSGVCGAAVILAARMNNYRRTLREVVLCAKVTELTVSKRLEEFKETGSSKLSVNEFRDDETRDQVRATLPPSFLRGLLPPAQKGKRRRSKKAVPVTAIEIEDEGSVDEEEAQGSAEPPRKRPRIDADGFAVPAVPSRSSQTHHAESPPRPGRGKPKGTKNWRAPPPTEEELEYENQVEHDIQHALDSNQDLDETRARELAADGPAREITPADVAVYQHDVQPRDDPPGPVVWSNIGNEGDVNMDSTIGDTEFDDDPEVSTCILSDAERVLKEKIWVTENAEWLRQDHAKRIRRELRDAHLREQGIDPDELNKKGKLLKRKDGARRSGKVGDVDYLNDDYHKRKTGIGEFGQDGDGNGPGGHEVNDAKSSVRKMFNQRGTFSRRINYQSLLDAYELPSESPSRSPTRSPSRDGREASVVSTASSTTNAARRRGLGEIFHGTRSSQHRSRGSIAQEKRQARERTERANRQTRTRTRSASPASAREGSGSRSRSRSRSPDETRDARREDELVAEEGRDSALRRRSASALSPPPSRPHPPVQTNNDGEDNINNDEPISDTDSPLSSTHTPGSFGSGANTPNSIPTIHPSTSTIHPPSQLRHQQRQSQPEEPHAQAQPQAEEDAVSDDSDDYIDPDEDVDDDDNEGDGLDAAFAGQYSAANDYEWNDEVVDDDD